jgi:hypothetical protein
MFRHARPPFRARPSAPEVSEECPRDHQPDAGERVTRDHRAPPSRSARGGEGGHPDEVHHAGHEYYKHPAATDLTQPHDQRPRRLSRHSLMMKASGDRQARRHLPQGVHWKMPAAMRSPPPRRRLVVIIMGERRAALWSPHREGGQPAVGRPHEEVVEDEHPGPRDGAAPGPRAMRANISTMGLAAGIIMALSSLTTEEGQETVARYQPGARHPMAACMSRSDIAGQTQTYTHARWRGREPGLDDGAIAPGDGFERRSLFGLRLTESARVTGVESDGGVSGKRGVNADSRSPWRDVSSQEFYLTLRGESSAPPAPPREVSGSAGATPSPSTSASASA